MTITYHAGRRIQGLTTETTNVSWNNATSNLVSISGNQITNTGGGWGDSRAKSNTSFNGSDNTKLSYSLASVAGAGFMGFDLTSTPDTVIDQTNATIYIDFGDLSHYYIQENGSYTFIGGAFLTSDTFQIELNAGVVKFYKNNILVYTSVINYSGVYYIQFHGVGGFSTISTTTSPTIKPTNVQAGSRFEETDTRKMYFWDGAKDTLGSTADIQISGATYSQSGILGNALSFDGVNDVGVCGSSVSQFNFMHNTTALFSINFWVKRITLAQPPVIFTTTSGSTNNIGVWINFVTNNNIDFAIVRGVGGTYVVTNANTVNIADTTTWHMVTFTYDQSLGSLNLKSYLDGTASTTLNKTVNAPSNSNATRAPNMFSDANFGFGANYFDEMSIWNRILTQSEITSLYNSGTGATIDASGISKTGLKAYYNFNETSGNLINQAKGWTEEA